MTPITKFKQLKGLFKDCRKKQVVLLILCSISVVTNILLVYQIQSLIDSVVDGSSRFKFLQILIRIAILGMFAFVSTVVQTRK